MEKNPVNSKNKRIVKSNTIEPIEPIHLGRRGVLSIDELFLLPGGAR